MTDGTMALTRPQEVLKARKEAASAWILQLGFIAVHVPIAIAIGRGSRLGAIHALAVFGIGLVAAVMPRKSHLVAYAAAYITGAAVFWRMKGAKIPWEFGKYAVVAIFVVALIASVRVRRGTLPVSYLLLLVPSAFLTVSSVPWDEAKEMLSFNLSGPIALAASVLYFSSIRLSPGQLRWLAVCLLAPTISIATVAAYSLQAALQDPDFDFYGGTSNFATSGHFGPNQVSAALGLGLVAILIYFIAGKMNRALAGSMLLLTVFLARQCLITMSRGGFFQAAGAAVAASLFLVQDRRFRGKVFAAAGLVGAILILIIIPRLQAITGGVLVSRFENTSGTGRELLIKGDMDSWSQNPLLGVGPGLGGVNRLKYFNVSTAHTEYTRLPAEHGFLGLIALILMVAMAIRSVQGNRTMQGKAIAAALVAYAALFMLVDGMRLAGPAFAFGLAGTTIVSGRRPRPPAAARRSTRRDGAEA